MCGATIFFLATFFKFENHECEYVRQSAVHFGRTLICHKTSFFLTALFSLTSTQIKFSPKNANVCVKSAVQYAP